MLQTQEELQVCNRTNVSNLSMSILGDEPFHGKLANWHYMLTKYLAFVPCHVISFGYMGMEGLHLSHFVAS